MDRVSLRRPMAAHEWYSINSQEFSGLPGREGCNARMMHAWRSEQGSCTCRTMSIWLRNRSPRAVSAIENGRWTAHARKCRVFDLNGCGRRESEQWTQERFWDARNDRESMPANSKNPGRLALVSKWQFLDGTFKLRSYVAPGCAQAPLRWE